MPLLSAMGSRKNHARSPRHSKSAGLHHDLPMPGAELLGNLPRVGQLIERLFAEADGETFSLALTWRRTRATIVTSQCRR